MSHPSLEELRNQRVRVRAQGILYRGILHGADEEMVYLMGRTGYLVIPMSRVTSVLADRPDGEEAELSKSEEGLSAEFYEPEGSN